MKQKAGMVLCVLFGAALVMMCDSDAVQDMVDGEEAAAATSSELAGISCPEGSVLVASNDIGVDKTFALYSAACWNVTTKAAQGPAIVRDSAGGTLALKQFEAGLLHGLQLVWDLDIELPGAGVFTGAACYDAGTEVWSCAPIGEEHDYECTTQEEVEALAAEHGCP